MDENNKETMEKEIASLMTVPSIGELTARALIKGGFNDIGSIEEAGFEKISKLEGMGENKAKGILDEIRGIIPGSADVSAEFICPGCGAILSLNSEMCPECDASYSTEEEVFLPGGILLDDPLETLSEYDVKITDGEDDEDVWFGRGAILECMGAYEAAYESFDMVIEFDPLYDQIWNARARLAMKLGKIEEAARAYKLVVNSKMEGLEVLQNMYFGGQDEEDIPKKVHSIEAEVVEQSLAKARREISDLKGKTEYVDNLQDILGEASKARNVDDREKAVELANEVTDKIAALKETLPLLEEIQEKLALFEDDEKNLEMFYNRFQELIQGIQEGLFTEMVEKAKGIHGDMSELLQDGSTVEEAAEPEITLKEDIVEEDSLPEEETGVEEPLSEPETEAEEPIPEQETEVEEPLPEQETETADEFHDALEDARKLQEETDEYIAEQKSLTDVETPEQITQGLSEAELEEVLSDARNALAEARDTGLRLDNIKTTLKAALELKNEGALEEARERMEQVINDSKLVTDIFGILEWGKKYVMRMKDSDMEFKLHLNKLKEIKALGDQGDYQDAISQGEIALRDMRNILGIEEEEEMQYPRPEQGDVSDGEKEKNLKKGIEDLKKLIVLARTNHMDVTKVGELINSAMISANKESYEEAIYFMKEGTVRMKEQIDEFLSEKIQYLENMMERPDEDGLMKECPKYLESARKAWESGEYDSAIEQVKKGQKLCEAAKTPVDVARDKIKELEQLVEDAEFIGMDMKKERRILHDAMGNIESAPTDDAMAKALKTEVEREIMKDLPDKLKVAMKNAQKDLQDAKVSGKNISNQIYLLKQVNIDAKEENIIKSVKYLKKYKNDMRDMAE